MMTKKEFFKTLTRDMALYGAFNAIRELMFKSIAVTPKSEMDRELLPKLFDSIKESGDDISLEQDTLINSKLQAGESMRFYHVNHEGLRVILIINMTNEGNPDSDKLAYHLQTRFDADDERRAVSVIIFMEKHHSLRPVQIPKVIKHELCHAVIEKLIDGHADLEEFYNAEENDRFIELLCNVVPYLAVIIGKESGIVQFMSDASVIFGYELDDDNPDEEILKYLEIIQEVEQESPDLPEETEETE